MENTQLNKWTKQMVSTRTDRVTVVSSFLCPVSDGQNPRNYPGPFVCLFVCKASTPLTLSVHQEHIQMVRSQVAQKRPARGHFRNGPWTHAIECCFEVVYVHEGMYVYVCNRQRVCNFHFFFFGFIKCVIGLRYMCCGESAVCNVKCIIVGSKW